MLKTVHIEIARLVFHKIRANSILKFQSLFYFTPCMKKSIKSVSWGGYCLLFNGWPVELADHCDVIFCDSDKVYLDRKEWAPPPSA